MVAAAGAETAAVAGAVVAAFGTAVVVGATGALLSATFSHPQSAARAIMRSDMEERMRRPVYFNGDDDVQPDRR